MNLLEVSEMFQLTLDLKSSAEIVGLDEQAFLKILEKQHSAGVFKSGNKLRVSVFTLAQMLNTKPEILLEFIEDYTLGRMMEEVEGDETFGRKEGWQVYQTYLEQSQE
jgi:hypothetical protein